MTQQLKRHAVLAVLSAVIALMIWRGAGHKSSDMPVVSDDAVPPVEAILRRGNGAEPESLNPQTSRTDSAFNLERDLFEGLITHAPSGDLVPGVAASWDISDDGRVYTFHLRPEARWSNGDAVVAGDFEFSFRRLADPSTAAFYAQNMDLLVNGAAILSGQMKPETLGVEALDPATLRLHLVKPAPYLLDLLTHPSMYPVHAASLLAHGKEYGRPGNMVSNGAFTLEDWVVGAYVTARRNPYYWNNAANHIEQVIYYNTADDSAELKRYRAGELDFTNTIPLQQFRWIKENLAAELKIYHYLTTYYYGLNLRQPPFRDNPQLRQALAMAVDRELLTEKITGVGEVPAYGWVPPGTSNYTPQVAAWAALDPQQRIQQARELYASAGYGPDNPAEVEIRYNTAETHQRIAVAIASMWKETLGVQATLVNEEFQVLIQHIRQGETQVFRSSWIGDYNDAFTFAQFFQSDFDLNLSGYSNPAYDSLLEQAGREVDLQQRRALLEQAERMMLADTPVIPLYFHVSRHLVKPWVRGWQDNIMNLQYSRHLSLQRD
ncbi:MAG: peptide ABC transporter substrate-binding protein [Gammaproteobacteria bacterium]|nr:peptide ABC transporter substrate-binding protein [Gammaproteobacteria bacterium]